CEETILPFLITKSARSAMLVSSVFLVSGGLKNSYLQPSTSVAMPPLFSLLRRGRCKRGMRQFGCGVRARPRWVCKLNTMSDKLHSRAFSPGIFLWAYSPFDVFVPSRSTLKRPRREG